MFVCRDCESLCHVSSSQVLSAIFLTLNNNKTSYTSLLKVQTLCLSGIRLLYSYGQMRRISNSGDLDSHTNVSDKYGINDSKQNYINLTNMIPSTVLLLLKYLTKYLIINIPHSLLTGSVLRRPNVQINEFFFFFNG